MDKLPPSGDASASSKQPVQPNKQSRFSKLGQCCKMPKMPKMPRLTKGQKGAAATIAILVALVVGGALAIHYTVGFPAAGDALKQAWHTTATWLKSASNLTNGEGMLYIGVPALAVGAGLGIGGYIGVNKLRQKRHTAKESSKITVV